MAYLATADELSGSGAPSTTSIEALVRDAVDIKSVADATAQAQAVTDWPTATGAAISAANPVRVWRQDLDALNISEDGTNWLTIYAGDSGLVSCTLDAGFTGGADVRRVGKLVEMTASITGTIPEGVTQLGTVPAGYRPGTGASATTARCPANTSGSYPATAYVGSDGVFGVIQRSGASRTSVQWRGTWLIG